MVGGTKQTIWLTWILSLDSSVMEDCSCPPQEGCLAWLLRQARPTRCYREVVLWYNHDGLYGNMC